MDGLEIKEYENSDRKQCIELLKKTFVGFSDEKTFKWRFETPKRKKPLIVCAKHNNKVVSLNTWIPWEFEYNKNIYYGYQSGESATDVNYRRKGIFSKILSYGEKKSHELGIDFFFGFPSQMSYSAFYKAGYVPVSINSFYVRHINPFKKSIKLPSNTDDNDIFDTMLKQPDRITPIVHQNYCKWRYTDNPKPYEIIRYNENNCKSIYFLRKKKWKFLTELILIDCQFSNYNESFIENSIKFLEKRFTRKAVYIRSFFNEFTDRGRALRKYFYKRIKSKYHILIIKPISNRIDNYILFNCNYWDIAPHIVDEL